MAGGATQRGSAAATRRATSRPWAVAPVAPRLASDPSRASFRASVPVTLACLVCALLVGPNFVSAGGKSVYLAQPWHTISSYCLGQSSLCGTTPLVNGQTANLTLAAGDDTVVFVSASFRNTSLERERDLYYSANPTPTLAVVDPVTLNTTIGLTPQAQYYSQHCNSVSRRCFSNITAQFYPKVDEYTLLSVPASTVALRADSFQAAPQILLSNNLFAPLETLPFFYGGGKASDAVANFRSVVITLSNGAISKMEWEKTTCRLKACSCLVDTAYGGAYSICTDPCNQPATPTTNSTACGVNIYLSWAGTDRFGRKLSSASYSIYKYENII